jgi:hypothetical protein
MLGGVNSAEVVLLIAVIAVPVLLGVVLAHLGRPWWWGAIAAIVIFLAAAILPEPEAGEPRVATGDVLFLVVVALVGVGLVRLGAFVASRAARRRRGA